MSIGLTPSQGNSRRTPQKARRLSFATILDIFWLKDESLEDSDNLPPPEVLAQEIVEDLEAALKQFREIAEDLGGNEKVI